VADDGVRPEQVSVQRGTGRGVRHGQLHGRSLPCISR
jgi:hypothetical protein